MDAAQSAGRRSEKQGARRKFFRRKGWCNLFRGDASSATVVSYQMADEQDVHKHVGQLVGEGREVG